MKGTQFVTSDAGNDNSDTFVTRILCLNCWARSDVTLPKGSVLAKQYVVTPRYTLADGTEGTIICGNCGLY